MSGVASATATVAIMPNAAASRGTTVMAGASLLPPPEQPVGSIESLYALMEQANAQQQKNGKVAVEGKFAARRAALQKFQAELKKAQAEKSSGVLGTIAKIGAVAAAAVATVCTCGAGAPALVMVGVAISGAGMLVSETKCLDFMGKDVSKWVGMGLAVAGALTTGGAGLFASAGSAASAGAGAGAAGASAGGGAAGAGASVGASAASGGASVGASAARAGSSAAGAAAAAGSGANSATTAVKLLEAGSAVASGLQTVDTRLHERRADEHRIDAQAAQHQMKRIQDAIEEIITELEDAKEASGRRGEAVNNIVETEGKTLVIAAGGRS